MWSFFAKRKKKRRDRPQYRKPELTIEQILAWADAHRARTGAWPKPESGRIPGAEETWHAVQGALQAGWRGLPGGSTIPRLLAEHRGYRNIGNLPPLSYDLILRWADAHHQRTGEWPQPDSGRIPGTEETWMAVQTDLLAGCRGLPGGSTLPRLLAEHRGYRNIGNLPPLSYNLILRWADAHHHRTGEWPQETSGEVVGAPGETWFAVDRAMRFPVRGLLGGSSLAQLLAQERGVRNRSALPPLTVPQILDWADAYFARTGEWPYSFSGPIPEAPGETWKAVAACLDMGTRGLPGGSSLTRLLAQHRGMRNRLKPSPLTEGLILRWADAHHERTGHWPTHRSGPVVEAPGERWKTIDWLLKAGQRGLPGESTLARLLLQRRQVRSRVCAPQLSVQQILRWADDYRAREGKWPTARSGPILEAPGETWNRVTKALAAGLRGLPPGLTLARLLVEQRGARKQGYEPRLTVRQILGWADAYHGREGRWPSQYSGEIPEAAGENWAQVNEAMIKGYRGLPGESSLALLLEARRGKRHQGHCPPLTVAAILGWADAYHQRTGEWPEERSGPIPEAPGETWLAVTNALRTGGRGLAGGASLARLLSKHRGVRNRSCPPPLTEKKILAWARAHYRRTGQWPTAGSGAIPQAGETWATLDRALRGGRRGLAGGSSLARLLRSNR